MIVCSYRPETPKPQIISGKHGSSHDPLSLPVHRFKPEANPCSPGHAQSKHHSSLAVKHFQTNRALCQHTGALLFAHLQPSVCSLSQQCFICGIRQGRLNMAKRLEITRAAGGQGSLLWHKHGRSQCQTFKFLFLISNVRLQGLSQKNLRESIR